MSIKAVVLDYGGVISFPPSHETMFELVRLTGLSSESLKELNRKYRGEWDRGALTGVEFYRKILIDSGVFLDDASLVRIMQTDLDGWQNINQAVIGLMRDIMSMGLSTGILSNMPHEFLDWVKSNLPIIAETRAVIFSCEHGMVKPEEGIYNLLREQAGCEFEEIAFFDDVSENVVAAGQLGLKSCIWKGVRSAREFLASVDPKLEALC